MAAGAADDGNNIRRAHIRWRLRGCSPLVDSMFVLASISDTVQIAPCSFGRPIDEVLREQIDAKYAGRVVIDVGLCLCVVSVQRSEGLIFPLDGSATYHATFQQLVFRPFMGEIIVGTIISSNADGLVASLDFFEDVTIPSKLLPQPSTYDESARLWTWRYDDEIQNEFHLDTGLEMRIRVKSVHFTKVTAHKRGLQATTTVTEARDDVAHAFSANSVRCRSSSVDLDSAAPMPSAMHIIGAINEQGLGPIDWWSAEEDDEEHDTAY